MKAFSDFSRLCLMSVCLSVPRLASAQAGDLTDNGTPQNVNQARPALPEVAANTPAGRFGDKSQLTISSDAGLSIEGTSLSGVDG